MGSSLITPEQAYALAAIMQKRMRRPDFRFNPGFAFHTSWDRSTGRPRARSTKDECINAVVGALMGKSTCPSQPQAEWLDRMIPGWRKEVGLI